MGSNFIYFLIKFCSSKIVKVRFYIGIYSIYSSYIPKIALRHKKSRGKYDYFKIQKKPANIQTQVTMFCIPSSSVATWNQ